MDPLELAAAVVTLRAPATGGSGLQGCSGDMLLEAPVACAGVTLKAVATALGKKLIELTERYCVVMQTIRNAPPVVVTR